MALYEIMIIAQEIIFYITFIRGKKEANFDSQSLKWIVNSFHCIAYIWTKAELHQGVLSVWVYACLASKKAEVILHMM